MTKRLGFRCWSSSDFALAHGLWGDAEVTRWIGGPFSDEQIQERLEREVAVMRDHGLQYWPIFLLKSGDHVGCAVLGLIGRSSGSTSWGFIYGALSGGGAWPKKRRGRWCGNERCRITSETILIDIRQTGSGTSPGT
jgi:RimJ/RimL family protein N-acetyltransferase